MGAVFLRIVNMNLAASWLILAVILARLLLNKAPKWVSCVLWALVAIRLICPFSLESALSLVPSAEVYPVETIYSENPQTADNPYSWKLDTGFPSVDDQGSNTVMQDVSSGPVLRSSLNLIGWIWLAGAAALLLYALISYIRLKRSVEASIQIKDGILACDDVDTPFILGIFKPAIYVPSSLSGETLNYVIHHEAAHLQRRDHWWKPLGFLLLAIYWFNPLCWAAYVLLCRDIESACDEKVIRNMDSDRVAAYAQALVDCSFRRRRIAACPLAFGEVGVKERVRGVLNYKKPALWMIVTAVAVLAVLSVCFLTNRTARFDFNRSEIEKVTYFNLFQGDDCQGELNEAQIQELIERLAAVKAVKKSTRYEGLTPGYQLCVFFLDGTFLRANGYHAAEDMVEIQFRERRYSVSDPDFSMYLRNVCSEGDVSPAQWDNRPMLILNGMEYIDPYKPETSLPAGYSIAGALSAEQANNTGLEGIRYYTNPNEPDDFYTYQVCGTPIGLDECDTENRNWMYLRWIREDLNAVKERRLTLDDVRFLSQKGEALSWSDFDAYQGTDIGSGLYIMRYVIDDIFDVLVGGASPEEDPWYIRLENRDINAWIDMRTGDVESFINTYKLPSPEIQTKTAYANWTSDSRVVTGCLNLKKMMISSVQHLPVYKLDTREELDRFMSAFRDVFTFDQGYDEVPSFHSLAAEYNNSFFDGHSLVIAYVTAASGAFRFMIRDITRYDAVFCMNVMKINQPESYTDDMAGWFMIAEVPEGDLADCSEFDAVIISQEDSTAALFEIMMSYPQYSSNPGEYLAAHPEEHEMLLADKTASLQYIFSEFLRGGQTGLKGYLMCIILDELAPEAQVKTEAGMGQAYFEEWMRNAERTMEEHENTWIEKNQPAMFLLHQMLE